MARSKFRCDNPIVCFAVFNEGRVKVAKNDVRSDIPQENYTNLDDISRKERDERALVAEVGDFLSLSPRCNVAW
jgi:hypothetical protein